MSMTFPVLLIALAAGVMVFLYNRIATLSRRCEQAMSDVDVQLRHRHELIPSLVETVKGFTGHERGLLDAVLDARTDAIRAIDPGARMSAEAALTANLVKLLNTPQTAGSTAAGHQFSELRREISDVNNKITAARRFHNLAIAEYNSALDRFPGNVIGRRFGWHERRSYDLGLERFFVEEAPVVKF